MGCSNSTLNSSPTIGKNSLLLQLGKDCTCRSLEFLAFLDLQKIRSVCSKFNPYCDLTLSHKQTLSPEEWGRFYMREQSYYMAFIRVLQTHCRNLKILSFPSFEEVGESLRILKRERDQYIRLKNHLMELFGSLPKLEELHLNRMIELDVKELCQEISEKIPGLTNLSLTHSFDYNIDLSLLNCVKLKSLVFGYSMCGAQATNLDVFLQRHSTTLETLQMPGSSPYYQPVGFDVSNSFAFAKYLPKMKKLNFRCILDIGNSGLEMIATVCPNVEHLDLSGCGITDMSQFFSLGFLQTLDISNSRISTFGINRKVLPNLTDFHGDLTLFDDSTLEMVAEILPNLIDISLQGCHFTEHGLSHLLDLKNLKSLNICETQLPNFGDLQHRGRVFHNLVNLCAINCGLLDSSVEMIKRVMPDLKTCWVRANSVGVSELGKSYQT